MFTTADAEIHFEVDGAGEAVVLTHGFSAHLGSWAFQRAALAASRRVVLWDVPGHGRSRITGRAPTIDRFADQLAELLDHLAIERAHVVGLSMGGMIALAFALRHPARLRSLVVSDTASGRLPFVMRVIWRLAAALGRLGMRLPRRNIAFPGLGKPLPGEEAWLASPERALVEAGVSQHDHPSQVLWAAGAVARKPDHTPRLGEIRAPTLLTVGADDSMLLARTTATQRAIHGSELAVFAGSVHATAVNRPAAYNALLLDFLDRVERGGAIGGERVIALPAPAAANHACN